MRVGIYTPYLDTLGGGERYILSIAEVLSKEYTVDILIDSYLATFKLEEIKAKIKQRLDLDLANCQFVSSPLGEGSNFLARGIFLKKYDLLIALTDGSIFYSTAKKSYLHLQSPIPFKKSVLNRLKLSSWKGIIYNSEFTRQNAQVSWGIKGYVIYPPVEVEKIKPLKKKQQILTVGRFFGFLRSKKHEVLIKAFKDISKEIKGWSFHLAGAAEKGDLAYVKELERRSKGSEIVFHPNLSFDELTTLYGESSIYWHAAGFEEEEATKQEHFGITTVEAMAGGVVPVVIKKGGQREIVEENKSGLFWENVEQLKERTLELIQDSKKLSQLSLGAQKRSRLFSKNHFNEQIKKIIV